MSKQSAAAKTTSSEGERCRALKRILMLLSILADSNDILNLTQINTKLAKKTKEVWSMRTLKRDMAALKQLKLVNSIPSKGYTLSRDNAFAKIYSDKT